jgi:chorismate dehydratase
VYICEIKLKRLDRKIRVGAVSYLNTKPLVYGLEKGLMKEEIELVYDYPSKIAVMLLNDEIDVGLVPVAIIPRLKEPHLITDFCIGTESEVASVCIFSEVRMESIEKVLLDYQSKTSVALAKLLITAYWKQFPMFVDTKEDYRQFIKETTAGLVIGDRAFEQRKISPFVYDLGKAWKDFTGLPFVFAAWISNKQLDASFIKAFNEANKVGLENIDKVIMDNPYFGYDLKKYYSQNISYNLTEKKKEGLACFLDHIANPVTFTNEM